MPLDKTTLLKKSLAKAIQSPGNLVTGAVSLAASAVLWNPLPLILWGLGATGWVSLAATGNRYLRQIEDEEQRKAEAKAEADREVLRQKVEASLAENPLGNWTRAGLLPDYLAVYRRLVEIRGRASKVLGDRTDLDAASKAGIVQQLGYMLTAYLNFVRERIAYIQILTTIRPGADMPAVPAAAPPPVPAAMAAPQRGFRPQPVRPAAPAVSAPPLPSVFRLAGFRTIWIAQFISIFGDFLALFGIISFITFRLHGTAVQVTTITIAYILPLAIFGPVAGVLVDHFNVKRTMIASDLIRGVLALLFVLCRDVPQIAAVLLALSVVSCLFIPAQSITVRVLVPRDSLLRANAALSQAFYLIRIASPLVAGALVAWLSEKATFYIDAGSFFFDPAGDDDGFESHEAAAE